MSLGRVAVLLGVVALAPSACGSGHHITFSRYARVGGLSVPTPAGFHRRAWHEGVAISDGTIGTGSPSAPLTAGYPPRNPKHVVLTVFRGDFHDPVPGEQLPLTLHDLGRASGGLTLWGGAFLIRGQSYGIELWLGRNASPADRSTVLGALRAIQLR